MTKLRADQMLVERGLADSRTRAQALILAGLVFPDERKLEKAGEAVVADAPPEVRGKDHPWVSRGGIKLAHALEIGRGRVVRQGKKMAILSLETRLADALKGADTFAAWSSCGRC